MAQEAGTEAENLVKREEVRTGRGRGGKEGRGVEEEVRIARDRGEKEERGVEEKMLEKLLIFTSCMLESNGAAVIKTPNQWLKICMFPSLPFPLLFLVLVLI